MASARILTQEYTAVICMADRSVTVLPEVLFPMKKWYALPVVASLGWSRDLNSPLKIPIVITVLSVK